MSANPPPGAPRDTTNAPTREMQTHPEAEVAPTMPISAAAVRSGSMATYPTAVPAPGANLPPLDAPPGGPAASAAPPPGSPGALPTAPTPAPTQEDMGIAGKLQEVMKARTVEKGSEVSVVKLADIIRIVREMLGGLSGQSEAALQDEIVRLKLQVNNLTAQANQAIQAERARADALAAEVERLRIEVQRLAAENQHLRSEIERLLGALEKANREKADAVARAADAEARAGAAEARAAELEMRVRQLEQLLGITGKTTDELLKEKSELEVLVAELDKRARSQRSDVRYAALVEEPAFAEVTAACGEVDRSAAKAGGRAGEQAQAAAAKIAAAAKNDAPSWKRLFEEAQAKRATTHVIARLEVLSGVHDALRGELERWKRATAE